MSELGIGVLVNVRITGDGVDVAYCTALGVGVGVFVTILEDDGFGVFDGNVSDDTDGSSEGVTMTDGIDTVGVGAIRFAVYGKFLTPTATKNERSAATTTAIGIGIQ